MGEPELSQGSDIHITVAQDIRNDAIMMKISKQFFVVVRVLSGGRHNHNLDNEPICEIFIDKLYIENLIWKIFWYIKSLQILSIKGTFWSQYPFSPSVERLEVFPNMWPILNNRRPFGPILSLNQISEPTL